MNQQSDPNGIRPAEQGARPIVLDPALAVLVPEWYAKNARALPWRHDCDPYRVWVSEIMLQQTRAEVVRGYYVRFLDALLKAKINTTLRKSRGKDVDAACGQLRLRRLRPDAPA